MWSLDFRGLDYLHCDLKCFNRWPFWKPTPTCWVSQSSSLSCTASLSFLPSRTVRAEHRIRFCIRRMLFTRLTVRSLTLRYPVLEQQTISRRPVCALHHIWSFPVSGGAAVYSRQRDQLCSSSQRLHWTSYWLVENHQGHGCQSKCRQECLKVEHASCLLIFLLLSHLTHCSFLFLQLDRERKIAGVFPRLVFKDKSTYVESSTKVYDDVSEIDIQPCF